MLFHFFFFWFSLFLLEILFTSIFLNVIYMFKKNPNFYLSVRLLLWAPDPYIQMSIRHPHMWVSNLFSPYAEPGTHHV